MKEPGQSTVLVYDHGLFVNWAVKLAESFDRVLYFCPWNGAFPSSARFAIGEGLPGVEKVTYLWDAVREEDIDLFFFPDCGDGDLQLHLREDLLKPVWGSAKGEELELFRYEAKQVFKSIGLQVKPFVRLYGMYNLREHLRENEDLYVKVSLIRGDIETFHHQSYELTDPILDDLEHRLGARKAEKEFIVEEPVSGVELGFDGYCIDGRYPQTTLFGKEEKDVGYIGAVRAYSEIPESLQQVNAALSNTFLQYRYRGFFSSEVREQKDGTPILLDPCCRAPSPPNEGMQELFSNWPEIIVAGAEGQLVDPVPTAKYVVEAMIHSDWAKTNWQALHIPQDIDKKVKLRNACKVDDIWYVPPQDYQMTEIGAVVGLGDSIIEAVEEVQDVASKIGAERIDIRLDSLERAVAALEESGEFSEREIPDAGEVAEAIAE